ncbi:metallophosphoesterase [Pedobacter sp. MC2016-05]|uniref:metallophosphoesterase n=1 Tax=Pedobacter sp. MC2016-05 TaxID=2994474 RepID=UPI002245F022|nr:metallophosphoesterase [Pedobacter sp. MC2016-05]MCX2473785.1 metallophosphoesterase [Pedobacter sp. MC2016-05]
MKKLLLAVLILTIAMDSSAQVDQDGPYIWHTGNHTLSYSIMNNVLKIDTLKPDQDIHVGFMANKDWDFDLKLHKSIQIPPSTYKESEKLIVLSDIEGEFEAFRALMIGNNIIDKEYNWTFGKGHLVICGDLFDRGRDVMSYLWLLYKLEDEASKKGGFVHVLIGNHDVMNMAGDFRYVSDKYPASAKLIGVDYLRLIAADTEIGKWLRSKNAMEKIGDKLFLHGGISGQINALSLSLDMINDKCRSYYGVPTKQLDGESRLFMGGSGPFWYRGYFGKERTPVSTVDSTLTKFGVKHVVVGHTITADNIAAYYGGKVIGVDVDEHHGKHRALLYPSKNHVFVVDDKGKKYPLTEGAKAGEIK